SMGRGRSLLSRLPSEYGIALALLALGGAFSAATLTEQQSEGAAAGEDLARRVARDQPAGAKVVVVAGTGRADREFADAARAALERAGVTVAAVSVGTPAEARKTLAELGRQGVHPDVIAASRSA